MSLSKLTCGVQRFSRWRYSGLRNLEIFVLAIEESNLLPAILTIPARAPPADPRIRQGATAPALAATPSKQARRET
jgi:hypothetical protein